MQRPVRSAYYAIYGLPLAVLLILLLFICVPLHFGVGMCFLLLIGWAIAGPLIARSLLPQFIATITCPGCREQLSTVGVWNCSCGFKDHRETNILTKRCPKCGKGTGDLDCPRCGCTILL